MTSLSLVVTTYNRSDVLRELLVHLKQQTDLDFQVVVAIDGSIDGTAEMLQKQPTPFELKWVDTRCTDYGLAVARNMGILASDCDAVVILDDDGFPEPSFVAAHKDSARQGVMTGGPRQPSDLTDTRMVWKMQELAKLPRCHPMTIDDMRRNWPNAFLVENNMCLMKQDWVKMGLFSERLKMYGFIGQEFFERARYVGMRYQFNHRAVICHHGELEGDNGLKRSQKTLEVRRAELILPTLQKPHHYDAQIAWAKAKEAGQTPPELPPFRLQAALASPLRRSRRALRPLRRYLKAI